MNRLSKRFISLIMVSVMSLSLLSGCGEKEESYRTIAVAELNGTTDIARESEKSTFAAYEGIHLLSGDDAKVYSDSDMTLELDNDKHVFADENTHFFLTASGKEGNTKTVINLLDGSVLIKIDNKLGDSESFSVDTPNSTMSVRGTIFRVAIKDIMGVTHTLVQTFDGVVEAELKDAKGKLTGEKLTLNPGDEALIETNADSSGSFIDEFNPFGLERLPERTSKMIDRFLAEGASITASVPSDSESDSYTESTGGKDEFKNWEEVLTYYPSDTAEEIFDEAGRMIRSVSPYERTEYTYHDNNAIASIFRYDKDYNTGEESFDYYTYYDTNGNIIDHMDYGFREVYEYNSSGVLQTKTTYTDVNYYEEADEDWRYFSQEKYDEHGNKYYEETYGFVYHLLNGYDMDVYTYDLEYDSEGRLLVNRGEYDTYFYEYDEDGDLIHQYRYYNELEQKAFSNEIIKEYSYVNGHKVVTHMVETYNEEGDYRSTYDYTYYDDGSLATEDYLDEYLYYDEVLETFTRFSQYEYDEYGNTIKTLSRYNDGEEIYEAYYTYTPVAFPAGKTGDMFTQKITTQNKSEDETYERYVIYRHK